MHPDEANPWQHAAKRLTTLEELFTHLQHTVETLDQVVQEQQKALAQVELALSRMHRQVESLRASEPDQRDPQAEKPPHY